MSWPCVTSGLIGLAEQNFESTESKWVTCMEGDLLTFLLLSDAEIAWRPTRLRENYVFNLNAMS
jgi:hypothetical protein